MIRLNPEFDQGGGAAAEPLFAPGDLVLHRRYGYRGVVVDLTPTFSGSDEWYEKNQTKPDKDQPWYHVLVDGGFQTTYAAQSSLIMDDLAAPITHPLVAMFFDGFEDGRYLRNEMPWDL
ncbi:MAG: heat shock protein HspQ [Verrucomicrobiota bacterium]